MPVKRLTFSKDLRAKDLYYSDDFFTLKCEKVIPSDSFSYDSYEAFKNVKDIKTSNYSNLFLLKKQKNSDWLQSNIRKGEELISLATTIKWGEKLLYYKRNYDIFGIPDEDVICSLTDEENQSKNTNHIFYINFINQTECTISHTFGDLIYYLIGTNDKSVKFSCKISNDVEKFLCHLEEDENGYRMKLYKKIDNQLYRIVSNGSNLILKNVKNDIDGAETDECYVTNKILNFDFFIDNSWVRYDRGQYISSIDEDNSYYNLETQALIHHEYNKEDGINFIPLKNNISYKGNTIRGSYNENDVDFREYNNIHVGVTTEKGNENIVLTFTFTEQEYEVNDGDDLIFKVSEEGWNQYNQLNINQTKFIQNGSFGSNVPFFADKLKKLGCNSLNFELDYILQETVDTATDNRDAFFITENTNQRFILEQSRSIEESQTNNGTYLCSWLYKADHETQPIWVDRYYYPDIVLKEGILTEDIYKQSFNNIIDDAYNDLPEIKKNIYKNTYYDKQSDLFIKPDNLYKYQRISTNMVNEVIESMASNSIKTIQDNKHKDTNISDYFAFDNENFKVIKYDKWNKTNVINFNTDIYLQRDKRIGLQLFGTDYKDGFNIQNRKDLTPFHYYSTDEVLYLCNNKFEIVHQFNLFEKFGDKILKVILGDVFDDVIVITGMWMYILTYDLMLKSKIDLTATNEESNAIKGIEQNLSVGLSPILDGEIRFDGEDIFGVYTDNKAPSISLVNYPYNHNKVKIENIKKPSGIVYIDEQVSGSISFNQKLIAPKKTSIIEKITFTGNEMIPSKLSESICKYNSIIYKNNIYIPFNQEILKIVMCPDTDYDFSVFTEEDREEYPAIARLLQKDEYYLNYTKISDDEYDSDQLSTEQGMIDVENRIKNIYITEEGKIYGLNYDQYGVAGDGDTIYGLYSNSDYIAAGGWWWIFNQSLSKMEADSVTSKYAEFSSYNSIDKIKFNELGEMCLIRNFNNVEGNINDDNNKRMDIYDKTKKRIYTYDLSAFDSVITLDSYNFIDEQMKDQTCFTALCKSYNYLYQITYLSNEKRMLIKQLNLPINVSKHFVETVNSNSLLRYRDYNSLYFNLNVKSNYTYDNTATIKWCLDDIQSGWYNINVYINLDKAIFELRINDIVYQTINEETHSWFKPYVSSDGTTFNTTYYIGVLGKKYGTILNSILKNSVRDPYSCKNSKIENMSIYNRELSYYEYQAMRMNGKQINRLILTLPCGKRNGIDEIVRYFKYNSSPAISNKVKINISGTGLQTEGEFDLLRKEIKAALENNTDCLVTVKDIEFV